MATYLTSVETGGTDDASSSKPSRLRSLLADILAFEGAFFKAAFATYRPEQHYMRGPGPAWRAKHGHAAKSSAV